MTTVVSPLLCDPARPDASSVPTLAQMAEADALAETARVQGERKTGRRGPALGECRACFRPIWRREYVERDGGPLGEKCGGRLARPRQPAVVTTTPRRPGDDEVPGQLGLFEVVVVKVKA